MMDLEERVPVKDFPLLWKVYDHIAAHPEEWNQDDFSGEGPCGTTMCFAGHTVIMMRPDVVVNDVGAFVTADGNDIDPEGAARKMLGLSWAESQNLFYNFTKNPSDLRDIIVQWESDALMDARNH
jgi:hypothetical protein